MGSRRGSDEKGYYQVVEQEQSHFSGADQLRASEKIDLSTIKNIEELTKEQQRSVLEDKFNLHFPKTTFKARKNLEYNQ